MLHICLLISIYEEWLDYKSSWIDYNKKIYFKIKGNEHFCRIYMVEVFFYMSIYVILTCGGSIGMKFFKVLIIMGMLFIGMSVQAGFVQFDEGLLDSRTFKSGDKLLFEDSANEVFAYPKEGNLVLETKGVKETIIPTRGEYLYKLEAYRDQSTGERLYTITLGKRGHENLPGLKMAYTRAYMYHFDKTHKKWQKVVDSANYYSPFTVVEPHFSSDQYAGEYATDLSDLYKLYLSFDDGDNWGTYYEYELFWDSAANWIGYHQPRMVVTDFE